MSTTGGPRELAASIIGQKECSVCGLCSGLCPNITSWRGRVAVVRDCGLSQGDCFRSCPSNPDGRERTLGNREAQPLGEVREIYYSRAANPEYRHRGQYGATVTALATQVINSGLCDRVLLTGGSPFNPSSVWARTETEILDGAGSKYLAWPTLKELGPALRLTRDKLSLVSRPCQVTATRRLLSDRAEKWGEGRLAVIIGVFCFWALEERVRERLGREVDLDQVTKVDVPPGYFELQTPGGTHRVPVDEIRPYINPACLNCPDSTAEGADLSVGATETEDGWNTLIIRTETGQEVVSRAVKSRAIELKPFPASRFEVLKQAVLGKKERVAARIQSVALEVETA